MRIGLERFAELGGLGDRLRNARVGLLGHAASCDRRYRHVLDLLREARIEVEIAFGPEHGFGGAAQDMVGVGDGVEGGLRVVSLYGDDEDDLVPQPEDLEALDLLVVDLVDVGARYYTFVWTALLAVRAASGLGVHTVLFDRPNPLGGELYEGRTQAEGYRSFVGLEPVPVRHGLTLAEMVLLHAGPLSLGPEGAVSVVGVEAWNRAHRQPDTGFPWVLPSPNMPTPSTAAVYPGGCLLEGTNLSEGRGHTRPFEIVGAPFVDGRRLARELSDTGLEGFIPRPLTFIPTFHKHAGQLCGGVQIHVTDPHAFRPVATYAALVALARAQDPEAFRFRTERYEFVDDIPAFDLLTGSAAAREAIEAGEPARDVAEVVSRPDPGWPERMREAAELVQRAHW